MNISKFSSFQPYTDPELETYFENLAKELSVFKVQAKQDGISNSPKAFRHHYIHTIGPIKAEVQKAIDFNYSRCQMYSDIAAVQQTRRSTSEKNFLLQKEANEMERKSGFLKIEEKDLKRKCKSRLSSMFRLIIPSLFGICEGFLVFSMLMASSFPIIVSFFLSLLTSLVAGFGLHFGAHFICKARSIRARRNRYLIVLAIAFIIAYALGVWRAQSYSNASNLNSEIDLEQSSHPPSDTSPLPFVIISFVSFLVTLAFEIKYWLSDQDKRLLKEYEEKTAEVKKTEQGLQLLIEEIERNDTDSQVESATVMSKQEYACSNESRLITLAHQVVGQYESINLEFRSDNQCPVFFGQPINFEFKLYFTNLFNSLKTR